MMAPTPGPVLEPLGQVSIDTRDSGSFHSPARNGSLTATNTKGLLNMPGQNNCFLNSAVQVLWHLDIFRRSFRELSGHACMAESCIFCALKELFTQFQYSQESALPPDALRHALAKTFCDQRRFQLGFMDDAAECFENILLRIHVHIANKEQEDMCSNANCIPHQKFAMTLVEQSVCHNCGATSEPLPFTQMVHYVTTSALCSKALEMKQHGYSVQNSFGTLLQLAGGVGEVRKCSSGCGSNISTRRALMNLPEIVSIGLVWDSESPSLQHITDVFHSIGMTLQLKDMFHAIYNYEWAQTVYHELVGIVTYYGKHYSTFFFHTKLRVWIYFDDAAVREIGPSWEMVVDKCQKGRFQPLLLLFANPYGKPLPSSPHTHGTVQQVAPLQGSMPGNSARLSSEKQAVIQKYLLMQNGCPNEGPQSNQNGDYANSYHQDYLRCDSDLYAVPTTTADFYRNQIHSNAKQMPVYSNTNAIGMPFPGVNYSAVANQSSGCNNSPIPYHIYSNIHVGYPSTATHAEGLPSHFPPDLSKANEICLPPINIPKCSSRSNIPFPCGENPELHQDKTSNLKDAQDAAKDSDSAFTEEDETYISRKTVENVLNLQKLQRHMAIHQSYSHGAIGNRNSSSSLESFDNMHCMKLNSAQMNGRITDQSNYLKQCDSGNWSGDRNSSSSNTSAENPFLTVVASKRLLYGLGSCQSSAAKGQSADLSSTNGSDHGYDSYSVSSSDSYPSINNSPVKLEPRLTQIPEDWSGQDYTSDFDKKLKLVTEDSSGPPDCDRLCAEADLLLAKSHEKEKEGDLVMAALLSDTAAARARAAMDAPYNNSRSLVSAKMKHSTCVMRSSCLYRRLKDGEADDRRKSKGHHSRQSSRDSTHSRHSRQGSKDSTHSKHAHKDNCSHSPEDVENFGKNIEIYGTLPKKGSRKKRCASPGTLRPKDDQVYKDFLDKQRKNTDPPPVPQADQKATKAQGDSPKAKMTPSPEKHVRKSCDPVPVKSVSRKKHEPNSGHHAKHDPECTFSKKSNAKQTTDEILFAPSHDTDRVSDKELKSPDASGSPDKKQHKIKRKLMGGFMKRKNRSLPDLRADELSDDFDHCIDDTAMSTVAALTLPNGTMKKLEYKSPANIGAVTRGFHQPHYAFVKKDLTQRPLLMKVNPPNVQCSTLKQANALPSIPKKSTDSGHKKENDKPSKIPFMTGLHKPEGFPNSVPPPLIPSESKVSLRPAVPAPPSISSIPVLTRHPSAPAVDRKKAQPDCSTQEQSPTKDDLPEPSNPFLAEIQAKRREIIGCKGTEKKEVPNGRTAQNRGLPSQLPKVAHSGEGASWLKELQSKQKQMCRKKNDLIPPTSNHEDITDGPKNITSSSDTKMPAQKTIESKTTKQFTEQSKTPDKMPETKSSSPSPPEKQEESAFPEQNSQTTASVKDLASRFENILFTPKEKAVSSDVSSNRLPSPVREQSSCSAVVPEYSAAEERCHGNLNSKVPEVDSAKDNETKCNQNFQQQQKPLPNCNVVHQRPQQPPDYETAMQRLEFMRSNSSALHANGCQRDEQPPSPSGQSTPPAATPPKKKGVKKTVTFSDEVVLVACAEYDDSGFFNNPLLERVYQKHIQAGGKELPDLKPLAACRRESFSAASDPPSDNDNSRNGYENGQRQAEELVPCNLCHTKYIPSTSVYCTDCAYYMSRYQQ